MALSAQQKADILHHLGYSAKTIITGSTDYSQIINNCFDNLSSEFEDRIAITITRLENLENLIADAYVRQSTKKVGDIELRDDELYQLKKELRRIAKQLSSILNIPYNISNSGPSISI